MCIRDRYQRRVHGDFFMEPKPPTVSQTIQRIDWDDHNFPPFINVLHFDLGEIEGAPKRFSIKLYSTFLAVFIIFNMNLLSTIIQVADDTRRGVAIFFAFLNYFVFLQLAGYVMYKGYFAACYRPANWDALKWYRIWQGILCALWFIFSILGSGCFDGWARIPKLSGGGSTSGFCIFLVVLESLGYLYACGMGIFCAYQIRQVMDEEVGSQFPISRAQSYPSYLSLIHI
eukprot:TRINITY_DN3288_c0_g1_i4.p1 TRINITY_DN3288_c0_g1~~TRINITY_DN3288_c0_g1_i4.p1  ORF type:complete len:229 (+),score=23.56 TRINITY_DN3288_c0_g1_i4:3-689(+)